MEKSPLFIILIPAFLCLACAVCSGVTDGMDGARSVLQRLLPGREEDFAFEKISGPDGLRVFEIESSGGKVRIGGSDPVSACAGLNWYLKYYCNAHISWCGNRVDIPGALPAVSPKVRVASPYKHGFYLNYCTYNYTMSWWDWQRWEKEIDWMALNGINMPLAMVGTEAVWLNTLVKFGYSRDEAKKFICGPCFFAWWLMGNLEGWGGPLPDRWIESHAELQKKILARMRSLGMKPVLQGFFGMVPTTLKDKFPQAVIHDQGGWAGGFKRPSVLDPSDPLFDKMADVWYSEMKAMFGEAGCFAGDLFHEGGSTHGMDVTGAGQKVYAAMARSNPNAVWVLQGWSGNPKTELLKGLDRNKTLILDLDCENRPQWSFRNSWDGFPWVWNTVVNFGGNVGLFGRLERVAKWPVEILADSGKRKNLVGIGSTPEGIENNPVVYELIFEMIWRDKQPDIGKWVADYATRRYGKRNDNALRAWECFRKTIYSAEVAQEGTTESILCARPAEKISSVSSWGSSSIYYDPAEFIEAVKLLLDASNDLGQADPYRYDVVDFTRQVLANLAQPVHERMISAFNSGDKAEFDLWSGRFLGLINDQDALLSTRTEFLLGRWLSDARKWGGNEQEKNLYEWNARTLITVWGFQDSNLHEYSHREWAGLLKDFYLPRWTMFVNELKSRMNGNAGNNINYYKWEETWTRANNRFSGIPSGDPVNTAKAVFAKYTPVFREVYKPQYKAQREEFVGRWKYQAEGGTYEREFADDGTLKLYKDGSLTEWFNGYTWEYKGKGLAECRKSDGTVFGQHKLQDADTLIFIGEKWGQAERVKSGQ